MNIKDQIINSLSNKIPTMIDQPKNQFAVLIPIITVNNEHHILFEVRSKNMNRQPGEVCFPGGKIEQTDSSAQFTAVRETCEELGVNPTDITDLFATDYINSGITIYAFVGFLNNTNFNLNIDEVETTFSIPLQYLLNTSPSIHRVELIPHVQNDFPYHLIPFGENYKWQSRYIDEYFYQYNDKVVWGLTARILNHFLEIIK